MKRRIITILNILILILLIIILVLFFAPKTIKTNDYKIQIIATIFPNYDFVKNIGGDKVEVKLLLGSGVESHTYEPTPRDMIEIDKSEMFIYTGNEFEPWAQNILDSVSKDKEIVDTSKNIKLINKEEFEEQHINSEILQVEEKEHSDESSYDSHIWMNPQNAIIMIDTILEGLCKIDPQNTEYYVKNAYDYKLQILNLDTQIQNLVENSSQIEIAFAGEFAYSYFIDRYNLNFISVYNNCGEGDDPSISKVKSVIDYINNHKLPVVFYEELSEGNVAKMIESETTAESLILYTIHNGNIEKDTYVNLMQKNYNNLKKALNY